VEKEFEKEREENKKNENKSLQKHMSGFTNQEGQACRKCLTA
jgi:hypothetical protein